VKQKKGADIVTPHVTKDTNKCESGNLLPSDNVATTSTCNEEQNLDPNVEHVTHSYVKNTWSEYGLVKSMMNSKGLLFFKFSSKDGVAAMNLKKAHGLILMCTESWGGSSYSRAMIEWRADVELKDTLVVVVPKNEGGDYTLSTIRIEYEWKPPRCSSYSSCDQPPNEKEVNLTSTSMPSNSMEEQVQETNSEVEHIDGDMTRLMASLPNRDGRRVI
ncbi:hypothetical protein Tco_0216668, partial [Tanacetum coccineum]